MANTNNKKKSSSAAAAAAAIPVLACVTNGNGKFKTEHVVIIVDLDVLRKLKVPGFSLTDLEQDSIKIKWTSTGDEEFVETSSVTINDTKKRRKRSPAVVDITEDTDSSDDCDYIGDDSSNDEGNKKKKMRTKGGTSKQTAAKTAGGVVKPTTAKSAGGAASIVSTKSTRTSLAKTAGGAASIVSTKSTRTSLGLPYSDMENLVSPIIQQQDEFRKSMVTSLENISASKGSNTKTADAFRFTRKVGDLEYETTVYSKQLVGKKTGHDLLNVAVATATRERSPIFHGIDPKSTIRYSYGGKNPASITFRELHYQTILDGSEEDTVQIRMTVTNNEFDAMAVVLF
jgi:hypothetical protein